MVRPRVAAVVLAAALGAGCASSAPFVRVDDVRVEGAEAVGEDAIIDGLATRDPRGLIFKQYAEYDEVLVARDRERIVAFYQREGYFSARVDEVVTRRTGPRSVEVVFRVDEGEPTRVRAVEISGLPAGLVLPSSLILVEEGAVYQQTSYLASKENLQGFLVRHGYPHAEVSGTVRVDRVQRAATVRLQVDPGPAVRFGPVTVRGLERLPESSIRARVAWREGDVYDPARVERTQARLYQLGFLSSVSVEHARDGRPAVAAMTITVREALRHELKLGGGVALDNANVLIRPRAAYLIKGLWDPLLVLELEARPGIVVTGAGDRGQLAGEIGASLARDDLLLPRARGKLGVTLGVTELETYSTRGLAGRLGIERPFLDDRLFAGLGYSLRWLDFTSVSPAISAADRAEVGIPEPEDVGFSYRLGVLEPFVALDLRDNPLAVRHGLYLELRGEAAGGFSGSQYDYLKLTPELRAFVSPVRRIVVGARLRAGVASGSLPITQRFFAGGASSQRGFTFRRLSPMSSGDGPPVPIGGAALVEASAEVRLDVVRLGGNWLGVAAFVDAGDVTLRLAELDPTDLHWAAGGGLRFNTVVGAIRFDVGYRLNRTGAGEPDAGDRLAFHLTLGPAF